MMRASSLTARVFAHPETIRSVTLEDWDLLIRQSRRALLLAQLDALIHDHGLADTVPEPARKHLDSARALAEQNERIVHWETNRIVRALRGVASPVVLLKGAAYTMLGLPAARGRLFSDVDILVPKDRIDAAERSLMEHGWMSMHHDAYDQRYYRQWMHELPPMRHVRRRTVLDVHHNILPETASLHPDPARLLEAARPIDGTGLYALEPADMVLHSATHLFHDGELEHGLRDLVDLDSLLRHFGREEQFWSRLVERAEQLDLMRPLYYALRYTHRFLDSVVPKDVRLCVRSAAPMTAAGALMDALFDRGLSPHHPSCDSRATGIARWALYVRSHMLRMPPHLLVPHLVRKSIRRRKGATAE